MGRKGRERVKEGPNSFSSHRHYLIPWALPLHPFLAGFMHRSIMRICHPLIGKLRKKWASKAIRSSLSLGLSVLSLSFLASPLFGIPYKWENLHCKYILKLCLIKPKPVTYFFLFFVDLLLWHTDILLFKSKKRQVSGINAFFRSNRQTLEKSDSVLFVRFPACTGVWILHMVAFLPFVIFLLICQIL